MSDTCVSCNLCSEAFREQRFKAMKEQYQAVDLSQFQYNFEEHSRPYSMILGLTNDCNLACKYCFVHQNPQYMTFEVAEQSILWLKENYEARNKTEKLNIVFFGGEPLLCYDTIIVPIVEKYKDIAEFSITTNGVLLDEDKVDFFYKNNVHILLSFDGVKVVQNKQRVGKECNSYDSVIKNIPYLLLRFPNTTMRMTITKDSLPHLYDSIILAEEMGFKNVTFTPNAYEEWTWDDAVIYEEQLNKVGLHIYKSFFNHHDPVINVQPIQKAYTKVEQSLYDNLKFNNNIMRCGLGTTSCAICPNGDIVPCQEKTSNPTFILGNVFSGIDAKKHEEYLTWYIDKISNFTCDRLCQSTKEGVHCLSNICPSRMEDLKFKPSTASCIFGRVTLRVTNRLFMQCYENINPWMQEYFEKGAK